MTATIVIINVKIQFNSTLCLPTVSEAQHVKFYNIWIFIISLGKNMFFILCKMCSF